MGSTAGRTTLGYLDVNGNWVPYGASVPTTGGGASGGTIAYPAQPNLTVGTSSGVLIAAGAYSNVIQISTLPSSTSNVWVNPSGGTAVVGQGGLVPAGGGSILFSITGPVPMPSGNITAITDGATAQAVSVLAG